MDLQIPPKPERRPPDKTSSLLTIDGGLDNASPKFARANAMSETSFQSSEVSGLLLPEAKSDCVCPAGHPMAPKTLRFYQGRVNTRKCSACSVHIKRQQVRHCCEQCDFQICLACFERLHLRRHQASLSLGEGLCERSEQLSCRLRWNSEGVIRDPDQAEEDDARSFNSDSEADSDESGEELIVQSHAVYGDEFTKSATEFAMVPTVEDAEYEVDRSQTTGYDVDRTETAATVMSCSRSIPPTEEKRMAEDSGWYTYQEFVNFFGDDEGNAAWKAAAPAKDHLKLPVAALNDNDKESPEMFRQMATKASRAHTAMLTGDADDEDTDCPEFFRQLGTKAPQSPALRRSVNAAGGVGLLRIPEAIGNSDVDLMDTMEKLPEATPPFSLDLRRFVRVGDILNYHGGDLWGHTVLCLTIPKAFEVPYLYAAGDHTKVIDTEAPVYALRVLESASNMHDLNLCTICLAVHPETKQICAAREVPGGMGLYAGRDGQPVHAEIILSPLNNITMDFEILQLALDEVQRVPQDQSWSLRTAVRAYLVKAFLPPEKYATPNRKRQLAWKIGEKWRERPICSSVPVRVWQKYLLKRSQKPRAELPKFNGDGIPMVKGRGASSHLLYCGLPNVKADDAPDTKRRANTSETSTWSVNLCGPFEGPQCASCLACQWAQAADTADPEVAWVEDVLRLMPFKDDRVLPNELLKLLTTTRLWQRLDFRSGPPDHRRGDKAPTAAEFYFHPTPITRTPLPSHLRNAEGAAVQLGSNCFTVYCGRQVGKPQKMLKRSVGGTVANDAEGNFFQWNGKCGPDDGPQCQACRRLEDRLPA